MSKNPARELLDEQIEKLERLEWRAMNVVSSVSSMQQEGSNAHSLAGSAVSFFVEDEPDFNTLFAASRRLLVPAKRPIEIDVDAPDVCPDYGWTTRTYTESILFLKGFFRSSLEQFSKLRQEPWYGTYMDFDERLKVFQKHFVAAFADGLPEWIRRACKTYHRNYCRQLLVDLKAEIQASIEAAQARFIYAASNPEAGAISVTPAETSQPDGPIDDLGGLRWNGRVVTLTKQHSRIITAVWNGPKSFAELGEEVWGDDTTNAETIAKALKRLNASLEQAGVGLAFTTSSPVRRV
jgi:hypothetical protein